VSASAWFSTNPTPFLSQSATVNLAQVGGTTTVTGGVAGSQGIGGLAADAAAFAGNPLPMAGKDNSGNARAINTADNTTLSNGIAAANAQNFLPTILLIRTSTGLLVPCINPSADGLGSSAGQLGAADFLFNGSTWDRFRNNSDGSLIASAAYTTTQNSADQTNYNGRRLELFINVSSAGTGSVTPSLQVKDSISGNYFTVWTAAAPLTANGQYVYYFADGAAGSSCTETHGFGLPARSWRLVMTANNANSMTYSASGVVGV
jgi:hypothetical protein